MQKKSFNVIIRMIKLFLIFQKEIKIEKIKEGKTMKKLWEKITMFGITISTMMYSSTVFAAINGVNPQETFEAKTGTGASEAVKGLGNNVLGMVSTGASVLAVIILIVLGVKYMMGSAEEKAEYKKTLLPYAIGAVFVFGAGLISSILFNMANTDWTAAT